MPKLIIKKLSKSMSTWLTSDPHFGHKNVIKYCDRPFMDVEEMNEEIIRRHNSLVQPGDIVYMLGDVAFSNAESMLERMNGIFLFIRGNHDRNAIKKKALDHLVIEYDKMRLLLLHNPKNIYGNFTLNVCGHVHEKWLYNPYLNAYNVGVDVHDFYPVSLTDIFKFCKEKGL